MMACVGLLINIGRQAANRVIVPEAGTDDFAAPEAA
jgi:hypothetical protein